ncbi:MAG: hypothetical protein ACLR7N_12400 [Roseburia hominis]
MTMRFMIMRTERHSVVYALAGWHVRRRLTVYGYRKPGSGEGSGQTLWQHGTIPMKSQWRANRHPKVALMHVGERRRQVSGASYETGWRIMS